MAYVCSEHGKLETEWCNNCKAIVKCDCSDQTHSRVKDVNYYGTMSITLYIRHCKTCGFVFNVDTKPSPELEGCVCAKGITCDHCNYHTEFQAGWDEDHYIWG